VRESAMLNGNDEDREFVRVTVEKLNGLTDLGRRGIFFVDSFHAIIAKGKGDHAALAETGIPDLERELEEYLVRNQFRAKLVKAIVQVRSTNNDAQSIIDNRLTMASTSLKDLEERFLRVQEPLAQLKLRRELIFGGVELGMKDLLRGVSDRARMFLARCPANVEDWATEYEPSGRVSYNPLRMKESIGTLAEEYLTHLKGKLEAEASAWAAAELVPWIQKELERLFRSVEKLTLDYNSTLRQIRVELAFESDTKGTTIADGTTPSTASKLGGIIYTMVTQDWLNGPMVSVFGVKGLLRGLAAQLIGGVILGIVASFGTPIGWVAIIITAVLSGGIGAIVNYMSLKSVVRSKVAASFEGTLREANQQIKMAKRIEGQIDAQLKKILEAMRQAGQEDANSVDAEVQKALTEKRKGETEVEHEKALLIKVSEENRKVASSILDLAVEAKV
jgi:hypothetical protein